MSQHAPQQLSLDTLAENTYGITPGGADFYKENCMMCLDLNGHRSGVGLRLEYAGSSLPFSVVWLGDVTDRMQVGYVDRTKLADFGACALALLVVPRVLGLTAVSQSAIGTTIDYYLGDADGDDILLFNGTARLEVSGILCENQNNSVQKRVGAKSRRLKPEGDLPSYIIVVEFSEPWSKMVEHE